MPVSYKFDENGNELLPDIRSVSWVNDYIKELVEEEKQLQDVYVSAEVSNFKYHSTGHIYFTLKDESSEIKAVMFRTYASKLRFKIENGMKVLVHARVGVYEKAGSYQLYVDSMQPEGLGSLYLAFEQLKNKLSNEGLFLPSHKKELPKMPNKIGIITSPTGAAIRDIIKVCKKRCPSIDLVLFPSAVQGIYAAEELVKAVEYFNATDYVDLIIIGRGGGSIEDLWSFNDETLARAIYNSHIPIISAVGHEIDYTICDFVADVRAATPSHAAEIATPDVLDLKNRVVNLYSRVYNAFNSKISNYKAILDLYKNNRIIKNPQILLDTKKIRFSASVENLYDAMISKVNNIRHELAKQSTALNALSPLSVLSRGYGVIFNEKGNVIKTTTQIRKNDKINVQISDGMFSATVDSIIESEGK